MLAKKPLKVRLKVYFLTFKKKIKWNLMQNILPNSILKLISNGFDELSLGGSPGQGRPQGSKKTYNILTHIVVKLAS